MPSAKNEGSTDRQPTRGEFEAFVSKVLAVPKSEIDARAEKRRRTDSSRRKMGEPPPDHPG